MPHRAPESTPVNTGPVSVTPIPRVYVDLWHAAEPEFETTPLAILHGEIARLEFCGHLVIIQGRYGRTGAAPASGYYLTATFYHWDGKWVVVDGPSQFSTHIEMWDRPLAYLDDGRVKVEVVLTEADEGYLCKYDVVARVIIQPIKPSGCYGKMVAISVPHVIYPPRVTTPPEDQGVKTEESGASTSCPEPANDAGYTSSGGGEVTRGYPLPSTPTGDDSATVRYGVNPKTGAKNRNGEKYEVHDGDVKTSTELGGYKDLPSGEYTISVTSNPDGTQTVIAYPVE